MKIKLDGALLAQARRRLLQMHFDAGVGHIGGNLSSLDSMMLLFHEFVGQDDRFILSKGHSAGALYVALWSIGVLSDKDLSLFHKDGTMLPGHPPAKKIPHITFATGSLGHGLSLAAGCAFARRMKGLPGHTFCLMSDGEWQEGSTWEALIFLHHHRLANLTVLIDHNQLQGFGFTKDVASMNPLAHRLRGFDIDIHTVSGHDIEALRAQFDSAVSISKGMTRVIVMDTIKGNGVSFMQNKMEWHYLPLDRSHYTQAIEEVGPAQ
jgi:transketolase